MLLVSSDKEDTWNLYNVMNNKVLHLQLKLSSKRFCGSSKGWLIALEENFVVTLINPFSVVEGCKEKENSIIRLPSLARLYDFREFDYHVYKATISADPILNAHDFIVTVIYGYFSNFAVIRLGKDTEWSYINFNLEDDYEFRRFHEVVHLGDKFYALYNDDRILSLDARDTIELSEIISELEVKWGSLTPMGEFGSQSRANKTYIVDSNEKGFLIVKRYKIWKGNWPDAKAITFKFEIFELNFDKHELIEKETLDDAALFLGDNSSMFVLASKLSGCQPNCIYFTSDYQRSSWVPEDFGVYNIKTQSISKPYTTTAMTLLGRTKRPEIWVMPTCRQ
ncbi:uncharacterized protein LOC18776316 [Prunus persica]|uniref:uncharacterized protein LOC18776316 n=1 Tax=Prunus persica TaxID=3760 RepID=UPI0009AB3118|nr:uncharacterized protein LOC18776316 [Prunus persica]